MGGMMSFVPCSFLPLKISVAAFKVVSAFAFTLCVAADVFFAAAIAAV